MDVSSRVNSFFSLSYKVYHIEKRSRLPQDRKRKSLVHREHFFQLHESSITYFFHHIFYLSYRLGVSNRPCFVFRIFRVSGIKVPDPYLTRLLCVYGSRYSNIYMSGFVPYIGIPTKVQIFQVVYMSFYVFFVYFQVSCI